MEHITRFKNGFDCINFECLWDKSSCKPRTGGSHGLHGLSIQFISKGDKGAVQFVLNTGLMPKFSENIQSIFDWESKMMPMDLGYHSKTPMYDGHSTASSSCEFCDGEPCYYDGSTLNASEAMYALVNGGSAGLWEFLDKFYDSIFLGGECPKPCEYCKKLRS